MSHGETTQPDDGTGEKTTEFDESRGRLSTARALLRRGNRPGVIGGLGGLLTLRGLRALRRGKRARGLVRVLGGGALIAAALRRRRSDDAVEESDVVDTSADIDDIGGGAGQERASSDEAAAVAGSSVDTEAAADAKSRSGTEPASTAGTESPVEPGEAADTGVDAGDLADAVGDTGTGADTETEAGAEGEADEGTVLTGAEELGTAAYDPAEGAVSVPEPAFDRGMLALDGEAVWGLGRDGAVALSQLYDPVEAADGVASTATSQFVEERTLAVPGAAADHWVAAGGWDPESGDDLVFATNDEFEAESLLVVVPEPMREAVLGEA